MSLFLNDHDTFLGQSLGKWKGRSTGAPISA